MASNKLSDNEVTPQIALDFINAAIAEARQIGMAVSRVGDGHNNVGILFTGGVKWDGWRLVVDSADEVTE